jgi:hypothetical protein
MEKTASWKCGNGGMVDNVHTYTRNKSVREKDLEMLAEAKRRVGASTKARRKILADGRLIETTDAEKWERRGYGKVRDRH